MSPTRPTIAIIGSGPSGCYTAQFLRRQWPDAEITIFEALPAPYGLLRYGVAADHQGTKAVSDQFDRLFERDGVRLAANITIGADLEISDIVDNFDVVVRATGLQHDRHLPIETDVPEAIIGAGSVLKALNGHPIVDQRLLQGDVVTALGPRIAVIGMGNVAMDVVRILCKPESGFTGSDVDDDRLEAFKANRISSVDIFGRSQISAAKFDLSMLKEILALPQVRFEVTGTHDCVPESCKAAQLLLDAERKTLTQSMIVEDELNLVHIRFHFQATPRSFTHDGDGGSVLAIERPNCPVHQSFAVDTVISATGFTNCRAGGEPLIDDSWAGSNVFKVGWLNRNGKGTVAANRKDAKDVSEHIVKMIESGQVRQKGRGFSYIEEKIRSKMIDYAGWKEIDRFERAHSPSFRCRRKLTNVSSMVSIAQRQTSAAIE
jgi:ferredoxin/flavodoxin---NADP+ reductase